MSTELATVAAARQLEVDGRDFFLKKMEESTNPILKKLFESLAADEDRHIKWLDDLSPGGVDAQSANRELLGKLKDVFGSDDAKEGLQKAESDIEVLDLAIGLEQKISDVYTAWSNSQDDEKQSKLGAVLAGQELFHKQLLQNTKEYLATPGDWFLKEEKWNFEGG